MLCLKDDANLNVNITNALHIVQEKNTKGFPVYTPKIVSEYDQEIPQSQTADNPVAPQERAAQPSRDTRKTN